MAQPSSLEPTLVTDAKALYDSYQREALGNNLTDKRTGLEVRVMKERLQGLGGRLRWMSSERQFADGLTKFGTRQLLADRLRYGKVKYTWDPNYVASKRKDFEERQQSRQEFAQPQRAKLEKVDEDEAEDDTANVNGAAACAFEIFMTDDGEPIEYKDVIGGSAVLNKYDLVTEDDLALVENPMLADEENTIMKYDKPAGWKLFVVCLLALVEPVATEPFFFFPSLMPFCRDRSQVKELFYWSASRHWDCFYTGQSPDVQSPRQSPLTNQGGWGGRRLGSAGSGGSCARRSLRGGGSPSRL